VAQAFSPFCALFGPSWAAGTRTIVNLLCNKSLSGDLPSPSTTLTNRGRPLNITSEVRESYLNTNNRSTLRLLHHHCQLFRKLWKMPKQRKQNDLDQLRLATHRRLIPLLTREHCLLKSISPGEILNNNEHVTNIIVNVTTEKAEKETEKEGMEEEIEWTLLNAATLDIQTLTLESDTQIKATALIKAFATNNHSHSINLDISHSDKVYSYIIPPHSSFYTGDILTNIPTTEEYDFIVMDPPWPNHSAWRKTNSYSTLKDIYDLFKLPIQKLVKPNSSSVVGIWITNAGKHRIVAEKLLAHYLKPCQGPNLILDIQEIIWAKINSNLEFTVPLNATNRHSYEILLLGSYKQHFSEPKVYFAIPTLHSQKPTSLLPHLSKILFKQPKCLELFARNLLPGWTSFGNEPLRFQKSHSKLHATAIS
jgi:N6-adenosine-specific RNA methylase IME4